MKLVEAPVGKLDQVLNNFMCNLVVSCSHCLIHIGLKSTFNVGGQFVDLLEGLMVDSLGIQDVSNEAFIGGKMNGVSVIVVFILKKSVVTLTITSGHFNLSHSSAIGHVADHT